MKWVLLLPSVQDQYRLIQQIMKYYHNPFDYFVIRTCLMCEERCLTCWRIWWAKNYRKLFWLITHWLFRYIERKWSQRIVFTFQARQYFMQDPLLHLVYSWRPGDFNRVRVLLELVFCIILHRSWTVWKQWLIYSVVYLPA